MRTWAWFVVAVLGTGCTTSAEPPDPVEEELRLEAVTETSITGAVGSRVSPVPAVRLTTSAGTPVPGIEIRFQVSGGSSIELRSQRTDTVGLASPEVWTLGTTPGATTLTAHAEGLPEVVFTATTEPGPGARIEVLDGNDQEGVVGGRLSTPLRVSVADFFGNPVPLAPVTFTVVAGGGRIEGATQTADALGVATSGAWTLGDVPGTQRLLVSSGEARGTFEAFACGEACRGQQLLFVRDGRIHTLTDGVVAPLEGPFYSQAYAGAPTWSPDGRRFAFVAYDVNFLDETYVNVGLYLLEADGSGVVGGPSGFQSPAWSPDGEWLALDSFSEDAGSWGISVVAVEAQGAGVDRIAAHAAQPAWAPDGRKIAFVSTGGGPSPHGLALMNADGSAAAVIVPEVDGLIDGPDWSPDGRRIAYSRCTEQGCRIHAVNPDGSNDVELVTGAGSAIQPAWSPDGRWIAFSKDGGLFYIAADGAGGEPIPMALRGGSPSWRP
jgi:Tol biopolymer transport system component